LIVFCTITKQLCLFHGRCHISEIKTSFVKAPGGGMAQLVEHRASNRKVAPIIQPTSRAK